MFPRICIALFLSGPAAIASGCSGSGNVPDTTAALSQPETSSLRDRMKIRQFSDLPNCRTCPAKYFPTAIAVGPDGALWVTDDIDQDAGRDAIARITPSGRRTETFYYQNAASPSLEDIVSGPDDALWISDSGESRILRMTTQGAFTAFPLQTGTVPQGITAGPDHALWFVQNSYSTDAVGRITTRGKITLFSTGISSGAGLQDIALGSDGALWFTEEIAARIGRITKDGRATEYSAGITQGSEPYSIAPGPDGALWFTELAGGRIGRITTSGHVTEFSHGITPAEAPVDLAAGTDRAMWFTEYETHGSYQVSESKIGRITMSGKITEYSKISSRSAPTTIVQGPDGNMWFVETNANRTGRVTL